MSYENRKRAESARVAHHEGKIAPINRLHGNGRVYLVQIGAHTAPYSVADFAGWLHSKYALEVQLLPPMALPVSAWDSQRKQYRAESLYEQIKREHPGLADNANAYLIGFTDADMYSVGQRWLSSFTQRDMQRSAVISAARMQESFFERVGLDQKTLNSHLQERLRRILLKDVAILYWHLPVNQDPTSLLHQTLDPDLPAEDIYESDLDPTRSQWGQSEGEPCILFGYSVKGGIKPLTETPISTCSDVSAEALHDESLELFEVDLRLGLLIDKHTDFYLPGAVPIEFQRATRDGWGRPMGFGISGSHNYDKYLMSQNMRRITVLQGDGSRCELDRAPEWLSVLQFAKWKDAEYSGRLYELRWRQSPFEHFDLKRFDGDVETYLPCDNNVVCYLTGYRTADGKDLTFQRDAHRMLTALTTPNKSWLHLTYGDGGRIDEITDNRGRVVRYGYDERGRMVSVAYPSGEIHRYEYDSTQHLLAFSVAPDAKTVPHVVMRNEYEHGKVVKQTFDNGETYTYSYSPPSTETSRKVVVRTPDAKIIQIDLRGNSSTVREREVIAIAKP